MPPPLSTKALAVTLVLPTSRVCRTGCPTSVPALAVLLLVTGSGTVPATTAELLMAPGLNVVTVVFTLKLAPDTRAPMLHVTTPFDWEQLVVSERLLNTTPLGRVSVSATPAASEGPLLVTVMT